MQKIIVLSAALLCASLYTMDSSKNVYPTHQLVYKADVLQALAVLQQDESLKSNDALQYCKTKINNLPTTVPYMVKMPDKVGGTNTTVKYTQGNYYDLNSFAIVGCSLLTGLIVWWCMSRSQDQTIAAILEKYGSKI